MTRRWILPLTALLFILAGTTGLSAQTLNVDEPGIRLQSAGDDVNAQIPIANRSSAAIRAKVELKFLAPDDSIVRAVTQDAVLKPGANIIKIALPRFVESIAESDRANLLWFRLQYRVSPGTAESERRGIVSLSQTVAETFRLTATWLDQPKSGTPWNVHVLAIGRDSGKPAPDVDITATLTLPERNGTTLTATARTGSLGLAALAFKIPDDNIESALELNVKARQGIEFRELREDVYVDGGLVASLMIDKPIYQPGQTMRMRTLIFARNGAARREERLQFKVTGVDEGMVFRGQVVTSRFGEAHAEWTIPADAPHGRYTVAIESPTGDTLATQLPLISRYDLPLFKVRAKPDRTYYLADEEPVVEIQADYLFGQPVARALVKIIDADGANIVADGTADAMGHFSAKLDLNVEKRLLKEGRVQSFEDGTFIAYVTDPVSDRTEEVRFDIRLSREPLHVYVTPAQRAAKDKPQEFFVSTQYADGTPAECVVEIRLSPSKPMPIVVKTNRFGLALVDNLPFDDDTELLVSANDGKGRTGQTTFSWNPEAPEIEVFSDKRLYASGEPLRIDIESMRRTGVVLVDVFNRDLKHSLETRALQLSDGKASLTFPYSKSFAGVVVITARFWNDADSANWPNYASRAVRYPGRELQLEAVTEQQTYGPGEEATVAFRVRTRDGAPAESLLGVTIVDRAVDERAIGLRPPFYYSEAYLAEPSQASGVWGELDRLPTKDIPPDAQVAAEYMLSLLASWAPRREINEDSIPPIDRTFGKLAGESLAKFKSALVKQFEEDRSYPENDAQLGALLLRRGVDPVSLRDPWGTPYRYTFSYTGARVIVVALSAGPDKNPETADDFTADTVNQPYFQRRGEVLNKAVTNYRARTGVIPSDLEELKKALREAGEDIDAWKDPWGQPFRFEFSLSLPVLWAPRNQPTIYRSLVLSVRTPGPDGVFKDPARNVNDTQVWQSTFSGAMPTESKLQLLKTLTSYARDKGTFPSTPAEWREALQSGGIDANGLKDLWGRPAYPVFDQTDDIFANMNMALMAAARLSLDISYDDYLDFFHASIRLRSNGLDGVPGNADDFDIARLSRRAGEEALSPAQPEPDSRGSIHGILRDTTGKAAPNVEIRLSVGPSAGRAVSGEDGAFEISGLAPGAYDVQFQGRYYMTIVIRRVPVSSGPLDLSIQVPPQRSSNVLMNAVASLGMVLDSGESGPLPKSLAQKDDAPKLPFTPRLREYFPETLAWYPAIETNRNGAAELRFKLADSITSWRVSALASTVDGRIARAETSLLSYERFFLEHDPPRVLTEGDRISLPVTIRNYFEQGQSVDIAMKPETWFTSAAPLATKTSVGARETARVAFDFTATHPIKDGHQRVTATGRGVGDSVEKTVTVKPNGREVTQTQSQIFRDTLLLQVALPDGARLDTARGVVRILPDAMAHVTEAIEGILQRPHGCAEQVISSTYPSVIYLAQAQLRRDDRAAQARTKTARNYIQDGYRQLLRYQSSDGGFTYWGNGESDVALTAYAVRFLFDAEKFGNVDGKVRERAAAWLAARQGADGAWTQNASSNNPEQVAQLTAWVAYVLSLKGNRDAVMNGLQYVRAQNEKDVSPYALAAFALAALHIEKEDFAAWALGRLEATAHREAGAFWDVAQETPFHGWGLAGRIEATALAVRALSEGRARGIGGAQTQALADQGFAYLLSNKDRYGVWHSTQATVQVLDALVRVAGSASSRTGNRKSRLTIAVNGVNAGVIELAGNERSATPIEFDASRFLRAGINRIEIRGNGMPALATAQITETHYVPWEDTPVLTDGGPLFRVRFDKTAGKVTDNFTGYVEVERGSKGGGMLLAEIGLPPGAEVNRASLELALKSAGSLFRYEIQPDRIVAYLWPSNKSVAGFQFTFRARFALDAQTGPSTLYDYYNPDSQMTLAPTRFIVQ